MFGPDNILSLHPVLVYSNGEKFLSCLLRRTHDTPHHTMRPSSSKPKPLGTSMATSTTNLGAWRQPNQFLNSLRSPAFETLVGAHCPLSWPPHRFPWHLIISSETRHQLLPASFVRCQAMMHLALSRRPPHLLCVLEGGTLPSCYNSTPGHGSSKLNLRPIIQVGSLSAQAPLATGPSEWMRGLPLSQSDHPCQMPLAQQCISSWLSTGSLIWSSYRISSQPSHAFPPLSSQIGGDPVARSSKFSFMEYGAGRKVSWTIVRCWCSCSSHTSVVGWLKLTS